MWTPVQRWIDAHATPVKTTPPESLAMPVVAEHEQVEGHHTSKEFDPHKVYEDLGAVPFNEILSRVEWCFDEPMLYSNEPSMDKQAWARVKFSAQLGKHLMELMDKGRDDVTQWLDECYERRKVPQG